jgi:serine/threonine protein kinase
LFSFIEHYKRLAEHDAANLIHDMILAVRYLHDHGIVHRDLKLENFVLSNDGTLKLIDFGLSKHFEEHEMVRHCVGTIDYIAPEILEGQYDHRCDIWSLGIILFMLLTGSKAFRGRNSAEIKRAIRASEPIYDIQIFKSISPTCKEFLQSMLKKNPAERISLHDALAHPFIAQRRIKTLRPPSKSATARSVSLSGSVSSASHGSGGTGDKLECASPEGDIGEAASSMYTFGKLCSFEKVLLKSVATTLNWQQLAQLKKTFEQMDDDKDGVISVDDLQHALSKLRLDTHTDPASGIHGQPSST